MTPVLALISSRLLSFMLHVSRSLCIIMTILLVDDVLWEMAYCAVIQQRIVLRFSYKKFNYEFLNVLLTHQDWNVFSFHFWNTSLVIAGQHFCFSRSNNDFTTFLSGNKMTLQRHRSGMICNENELHYLEFGKHI